MSSTINESCPALPYRPVCGIDDLSSDESIFQVAAEFNHLVLKDGSFCYENEKTFLSAVDASKRRSEQSKASDLCEQVEKDASSCFEQLPHEALKIVTDHLDIASLIAVASVNIRLRGVVQSLPDIQKIQQNLYVTRALNRLYTCGTARHFSLNDFMKAVTSWTCGNCQNKSEFAVTFSLMSCSRVCQSCLASQIRFGYVPVRLAVQCFELDPRDIYDRPGFARLPVPPTVLKKSRPRRLRVITAYSRVNVVSLSAVFKMAELKYATVDTQMNLQPLLNAYLIRFHLEFDEQDIKRYEDVELIGLEEAIEMCWAEFGIKMDDATRLMVTTLPYLHPKTYPFNFESGIWCEGCMRSVDKDNPFSVAVKKDLHNLKVYVEEIFPNHAIQCEAAREVKRGLYLKHSEEHELKRALLRKTSEYWPEENAAPRELKQLLHAQSDYTAMEYREWYTRLMNHITELGERDSQWRRSSVFKPRVKLSVEKNIPLSRKTFNFNKGWLDVKRGVKKPEHRVCSKPAPGRKYRPVGKYLSKNDKTLIEQVSGISMENHSDDLPDWYKPLALMPAPQLPKRTPFKRIPPKQARWRALATTAVLILMMLVCAIKIVVEIYDLLDLRYIY